MRPLRWLFILVAIAAIAQAEPGTGTVVISCNEADASLLVDNVLIPERTPAVLTLPAGTHIIEVRKPPLVAVKKVIEVPDQQQVKLRFDLLPAAPLAPMAPEQGSGSGSAVPPAAGSAAGSATGSAAGSGAPIVVPAVQQPPPQRCTEGGHEVACLQGPHCTEGGKLVPCKKGDSLPQTAPPPQQQPAVVAPGTTLPPSAGSGAEPARVTPGAAAIEIATAAPHAIAYIDGAPIRDAPCVLELEPGEHVVAVYAAGMLPAETLVRVAPAQRQRVELTPKTPRRRIDVPAQ